MKTVPLLLLTSALAFSGCATARIDITRKQSMVLPEGQTAPVTLSDESVQRTDLFKVTGMKFELATGHSLARYFTGDPMKRAKLHVTSSELKADVQNLGFKMVYDFKIGATLTVGTERHELVASKQMATMKVESLDSQLSRAIDPVLADLTAQVNAILKPVGEVVAK